MLQGFSLLLYPIHPSCPNKADLTLLSVLSLLVLLRYLLGLLQYGHSHLFYCPVHLSFSFSLQLTGSTNQNLCGSSPVTDRNNYHHHPDHSDN